MFAYAACAQKCALSSTLTAGVIGSGWLVPAFADRDNAAAENFGCGTATRALAFSNEELRGTIVFFGNSADSGFLERTGSNPHKPTMQLSDCVTSAKGVSLIFERSCRYRATLRNLMAKDALQAILVR